jgi:hypothetical protein
MTNLRPMTVVLLLAALGRPGAAAGPSAPEAIPKLWADLGSKDPATAERVMAQLAARPAQTASFLRKHLHPVVAPERGRVARWLADLDSDDFPTREQATEELKKAAEVVEPALKEALGKSPSPEAQVRIRRLLERMRAERLNPSADRRRAVRAVEVLERIGDGEARKVLNLLSRGAREAQLTVEARAALERLEASR